MTPLSREIKKLMINIEKRKDMKKEKGNMKKEKGNMKTLKSKKRNPVFSKELINLPENSNNIEVFKEVTSNDSFLPRMQLMTSGADLCKSGEFPINHYAVIENQVTTDVGKEVDTLVIEWRPKAIKFGEETITLFDTKIPMFKKIQEEAALQDSGCMFGPEFLLYLPSIKGFVTFFMGSKSARREAPILNSKLRQAATLLSKKIETAKYTWFAPQIRSCSTPFDLPDTEELLKQVEKFRNPISSEVEEAPKETERTR